MLKIDLKNTGKEPHELQLARVKDGTTAEQFVKEVLGSDEGAPIPDYLIGPAGGVGVIPPGTSATSTQKLDAGTYIFFCSFEGEAGPHYDAGMLGTTTLKGDKGKGDLPTSSASVKARDYGFDLSGLKAGSNTVLFENTGKQLHHAFFLPLTAGATFDQAKEALTSDAEPTGPPPVDFEKSSSLAVVNDGGKLVQTNLTLAKGTYAVVCFLSDKAGGPPHVVSGMIQQLDIS